MVDSARRLADASQIDQGALQDVGSELEPSTVPVFWHIPKTGGTTVQDTLAWCLGVPTASEVGVNIETANESPPDTLRLVSPKSWETAKFVNVDTTTVSGIDRAQTMGFTESGLARLIVTGEIPNVSRKLLDSEHKGMLFSVFRHPVERAVSLFYYLKDAKWEPTFNKDFRNMTLMEYAQHHAEKDWMVRTLLGKNDRLIGYDLNQAKQIISEKMWVGLAFEFDESIDRFGSIFGWNSMPDWEKCTDAEKLHKSNSHSHPKLAVNSPEWEELLKHNEYDHKLYLHAVSVFNEQRKYFAAVGDQERTK